MVDENSAQGRSTLNNGGTDVRIAVGKPDPRDPKLNDIAIPLPTKEDAPSVPFVGLDRRENLEIDWATMEGFERHRHVMSVDEELAIGRGNFRGGDEFESGSGVIRRK
jgi:hypothetical protein